jgi:hypothetical protein
LARSSWASSPITAKNTTGPRRERRRHRLGVAPGRSIMGRPRSAARPVDAEPRARRPSDSARAESPARARASAGQTRRDRLLGTPVSLIVTQQRPSDSHSSSYYRYSGWSVLPRQPLLLVILRRQRCG